MYIVAELYILYAIANQFFAEKIFANVFMKETFVVSSNSRNSQKYFVTKIL